MIVIKKSDLINELEKFKAFKDTLEGKQYPAAGYVTGKIIDCILEIIDKCIPTIEIKDKYEPKLAGWITNRVSPVCLNCNTANNTCTNYCPHCGAKMMATMVVIGNRIEKINIRKDVD